MGKNTEQALAAHDGVIGCRARQGIGIISARFSPKNMVVRTEME
jgi:hypothetical protein